MNENELWNAFMNIDIKELDVDMEVIKEMEEDKELEQLLKDSESISDKEMDELITETFKNFIE